MKFRQITLLLGTASLLASTPVLAAKQKAAPTGLVTTQ